MESERFAWIDFRHDELIDRDHPLWDTLEHERILAEGEDAYDEHVAVAETERAEHRARRLERERKREAERERKPDAKLPERTTRPEVPRVALSLSRELAAEALGVSVDYFDDHVKPHIRTVSGKRMLVPVRELERWLDERAAFALRGR